MTRFRSALDEIYGARIECVVLFGSRARGDARPDSDFDGAVFICDPSELWDEPGRLARASTAILCDTGAVISAKPFAAGGWRERTPPMGEIGRPGGDRPVSPEAARFMEKARQCLADARA